MHTITLWSKPSGPKGLRTTAPTKKTTAAMVRIDRLRHLQNLLLCLAALCALTSGCAMVGPDFTTPEAQLSNEWQDAANPKVIPEAAEYSRWWTVFDDPTLDSLIETAYQQNLPLQIAGLRIVEARAQLGFVTGQLYPQSQSVGGAAIYNEISKNTANTTGAIDRTYTDYNVGFDAAWELDFWGRFRRGVEAADAGLVATIFDYDNALVSLTAEVARTYILIRTLEERLAIAHENVLIQQRSYEIAEVRFEAGLVTELDKQQALSLLKDTQASIPRLQTSLRQAKNSLSILLGMPPGGLSAILGSAQPIPAPPAEVTVGIPAELLRRRPDIRRAELQAASQSALIGLAKADLYPHFTLVGSIGLRSSNANLTFAGGTNGSNASDLFDSDSLEIFAGPSITWNIFNYGRLRNQVRIQDARFQQLVVNYQNTVLSAAQEVEDSLVAFLRSQEEVAYLAESVAAAKRSVDLSLVQYREGLVDFQRVLDTQRFQTQEEDLWTTTRGNVALNLISMYKSLGGGWQIRTGKDFISKENKSQMMQRTNWGNMLTREKTEKDPDEKRGTWRTPDW